MTEPNFSAIRARLRYDSVDEFIDGYSRYVTSGGMFIPMTPAKLKPVGTTVRFQFVLGDGATALLGEGVVRQIRGLESDESDSPIGMLVKFTKLSQDSKVLIDRIVALKEIEKLGVDIFSDDTDDGAYSGSEHGESTEHAATTGNYSLEELVNAGGGKYINGDADEDEDDSELFSERTGRLEASELAGLGASNFDGAFDDDAVDSDEGSVDVASDSVAEEVEVSSSFNEWGPEPAEAEHQAVETANSGELSLDLFGFNVDESEASESDDLFSNEASSSELSFDFDFEMSESSDVVDAAESDASSSEDVLALGDLFDDASGDLFGLEAPESFDVLTDEDSASPEVSVESDISEEQDIEREELVSDADAAQPEAAAVASHVVRKTEGGLQIMSFDGSADASVDRDFEQFALGSDDDVDSMFDDVFGDAFDGAFGGMDDAAGDEDVDDESQEILAGAEISVPEVVDDSDISEEIEAVDDSDISEEFELMDSMSVEGEPAEDQAPEPAVEIATAEVVEQAGDAADAVGDPSEENIAALLFGEESESFSDDDVVAENSEASSVFEVESDAFELSTDFELPELADDQEESDVVDDVFELKDDEEESAFELSEILDDVVEEDEANVEEVSADVPAPPQVPVPAPPVFATPPVVEAPAAELFEGKLEEPSENSSELLSLLGALEESEREDTGSGLLSLSHGLSDKSSPVLDDEPDSLSALLASAQKELEARSAVPEEERQRDAIDELLGDDSELSMPPIPTASPFAVPEVPKKKSKGFMSKLFGKD